MRRGRVFTALMYGEEGAFVQRMIYIVCAKKEERFSKYHDLGCTLISKFYILRRNYVDATICCGVYPL
jgi:hypothetical protein